MCVSTTRVLIATSLVLAGCGDGIAVRSSTAALVRDSAGVRIVESANPAWTDRTALVVAVEPAVSIGEMDGAPEYQLYRVRAATRLSDGTIVALDGGSQELRFYDSTGAFVRRVGGKGGGPGEYQRVTWLQRLAGDSLMLHDSDARRITVLAPDGSIARSINLAAVQGPPLAAAGDERTTAVGGMTPYSAVGPMADGSLLATSDGPRSPTLPGSAVRRDSTTYVLLTADGLLRDTLATLVGDEEQSSLGGSEGRRVAIVGPPPFGRSARVAIDADGFWFGSSDRYELQHRGVEGSVDRVIRRAVEPIAVTSAVTDAAMEQELSRTSDAPAELRPMLRQMTEDRWSGAVLPATMPAHGEFLTDDDGILWVAETTLPDDAIPRWTAFDTDGIMLGTVPMPAHFRALEFGTDYVLGVSTDENEVEQLRLYMLRPDGGR